VHISINQHNVPAQELDADVVQYLVSELTDKRRYDMMFVKHDPYNTGILDYLAFKSALQELGLKLRENEVSNSGTSPQL
jgi:hypothetical protein